MHRPLTLPAALPSGRPELALCLLSEVAYGQYHWHALVYGGANVQPVGGMTAAAAAAVVSSGIAAGSPQGAMPLRSPSVPHLPLLLHACVMAVDAEEAVVGAHAQQLLLHLLYASCKLDEEGGGRQALSAGGLEEEEDRVRQQSVLVRGSWGVMNCLRARSYSIVFLLPQRSNDTF